MGTADAVKTNLQEGVDVAASVENDLKKISGDVLKDNGGKKDNIRAYTSALNTEPAATVEGFEADVSVAVVIDGDGIDLSGTGTKKDQKKAAQVALKQAVAS